MLKHKSKLKKAYKKGGINCEEFRKELSKIVAEEIKKCPELKKFINLIVKDK